MTESTIKDEVESKISSTVGIGIAALFFFLLGIIVLTAFNPDATLDRNWISGLFFGITLGLLVAVGQSWKQKEMEKQKQA